MAYLKKALEYAGIAVMVTDATGQNAIYHNRAFFDLLGYTLETLNAKGGVPSIFQNSRVSSWLYNTILKAQSWAGEQEVFTADGKMVLVNLHANTIRDEAGNIIGIFAIFNSITKQRQVAAGLIETQGRVADIIDFFPDATFMIDLQGTVIAWNKAAEEMTKISAEEMIGQKDYAYSVPFCGDKRPILIDLVLRPDLEIERLYPFIKRELNTLIGENYYQALNGQKTYVRATAFTIYDSWGNPIGALESIRNETEHKLALEKMAYLGKHDLLTGLYNRAHFETEMQRFDRGQNCPIGIIMCDVDGLKLVNDTFGHDTGDLLLVAAARVIRKCFQEPAVVARVGGDEFAILLPSTNTTSLEKAMHCIRRGIEAYNQNNTKLPLSISLGYALRGDDSLSIYELYKRADNFMYRKKLRSSRSARSAIVNTLLKTLEARDFHTGKHADRMQDLLRDLAAEIDYPAERLNELLLFAQFHDIGKVGIPDRILLKQGPLTDEEWVEMRRHSEIGHRIALAAPDLATVADWILKHHEWWNGQGYPLGLKGLEIPTECRMLAIVDSYDAMTSNRPYHKALTHEEAITQLLEGKGTQFDPDLVLKFISVIAKPRQI